MTSKSKAKLWITNKHVSRISYRALTDFEIRNPHMFEMSDRVHASWDEAHAAVVADRHADLERATKAVKNGKSSLKRALAMQRPKDAV